ncbi:NAD(P)/FAD-dependent oxidoreductase [Granulicella sp. L60]|uniref:NAD(P)/FAD-dependent oxidoreductase n=1 Tax=Granulicella sp. L60 TaxID=1641866 RepID=UPI00131DC108|nr:NAD(P)/FAD-dependent oxidoreductase [Granulicella sp. L60]
MSNSSDIKSVVIIGGGFAGLNCAQKLAAHKNLKITILDRNNYQQFQPLLYQVATGTLSPDNAAFNLRAVLAGHENVDVVMAEVKSVDLATRTAYSVGGDEFQGDFLVLAAGAEPNFFGIPGVQEHALPLYSLLDAEHLRSRLIGALETADRDAGKRTEPLRFVVIGGGATGVEIAGAIGDVLQRTSLLAFKHADLKHASVTLIDMGKTVLGPFGKHSQEYATEMLKNRGIELLLGVSVKEVAKNGVTLSDGTHIPAELVIWAGGLKGAAISNSLGIKAGRGGRVDVQPDLSVADFPGVYAVGDFANFQTVDGQALPQLASVAQQAGRHCAKNIAAAALGNSGKRFEYHDKGIMAMVGRNAAVAEVGSNRHTVTGTLAFAAWLGVHALLLTTVRAKVETFVEWAWEYFGHVHVDAILDRPDVDWSNGMNTPPVD